MKRTSLLLNPDDTKQMRALGKSLGLTGSHIIRIAIRQWIQREKRALRSAAKL
jgi:hypothetical protein